MVAENSGIKSEESQSFEHSLILIWKSRIGHRHISSFELKDSPLRSGLYLPLFLLHQKESTRKSAYGHTLDLRLVSEDEIEQTQADALTEFNTPSPYDEDGRGLLVI